MQLLFHTQDKVNFKWALAVYSFIILNTNTMELHTANSPTPDNFNERNLTLPGNKNLKGKGHADQKYIYGLLINDMVLTNELYAKFSGKIKAMVLQNNGNETDAADVFQEALLSIYKSAKNKNFTLTCPLDAFLYMVCKNKWLNELSKRNSQKIKFTETENFENIGYDSFKQTEEDNLRKQRKDLLMEKLAKLGEGAQQLLLLSWSGKSMEEVAEILHVSYGYARKKKSEAMAKLIKLVKQSPEFNNLKW
jgi:RNA polymerase sigma factor (sigma-70 family)